MSREGESQTMMMVRIRTYSGVGRPVGELHFPADQVYLWLHQAADPESEDLHGIRDLVDPMHENKNYDWDIWAKPKEVGEDLRGDGEGPDLLHIV